MTRKYTEPQGEGFDDLDREVWINGEKVTLMEEDESDAENDTPG